MPLDLFENQRVTAFRVRFASDGVTYECLAYPEAPHLGQQGIHGIE
jgi:hypothetical protein